jgi:acetoin utilization protein AcuB
MKVIQAMTRNVICIKEDDTLRRAYDLMLDWEIRHLPVVSDGKLVGIVSDRDVLPYLSRRELGHVPEIPVFEVMTRNVLTVSPSDTIWHVANLMSVNKIDGLPVIEDPDQRLVGLITSMDLIDLLKEKEVLDLSQTIPWSYKLQGSNLDSTVP